MLYGKFKTPLVQLKGLAPDHQPFRIVLSETKNVQFEHFLPESITLSIFRLPGTTYFPAVAVFSFVCCI